jgi:hypothetical protein
MITTPANRSRQRLANPATAAFRMAIIATSSPSIAYATVVPDSRFRHAASPAQ